MLSRKRKPKTPQRTVALELSRSELTLVTINHGTAATDGPPVVRWKRQKWRNSATSLQSEEGIRELSAALKTLVLDEGLSGHRACLALSSDFCVTRVVAGENEHVRKELKNLEERSALYLSLGTGKKIWASSFRAIDVKRRQAWMTITSEKTLKALFKTASEVGLTLDCVEHSLISVSRAVGHMGKDQDSPVLILEVGQRGVDLGISYRGQLLLDFRPGAGAAKDHLAQVVVEHLKRLQRYCDRYFRFSEGKIERIYLCGEAEGVAELYKQFQAQDLLQVEILEPTSIYQDREFEAAENIDFDMAPALGATILAETAAEERTSPNLLETIYRRNRGPLGPELVRFFWPIAAALLIAIGLGGLGKIEEFRCNRLAAREKQLETEAGRIKEMQLRMVAADKKLEQVGAVKERLFHPPYGKLVETLGRCLPEGVWLDIVKADHDGNVTMSGPSTAESGIYEFVELLKKSRRLQGVVLEGTQPVRLSLGAMTRFEVRCKFIDRAIPNERRNQDVKGTPVATR